MRRGQREKRVLGVVRCCGVDGRGRGRGLLGAAVLQGAGPALGARADLELDALVAQVRRVAGGSVLGRGGGLRLRHDGKRRGGVCVRLKVWVKLGVVDGEKRGTA